MVARTQDPALRPDVRSLAELVRGGASPDEIRTSFAEAGFDPEPVLGRLAGREIRAVVDRGGTPREVLEVGERFGYDARPIARRIWGERALVAESGLTPGQHVRQAWSSLVGGAGDFMALTSEAIAHAADWLEKNVVDLPGDSQMDEYAKEIRTIARNIGPPVPGYEDEATAAERFFFESVPGALGSSIPMIGGGAAVGAVGKALGWSKAAIRLVSTLAVAETGALANGAAGYRDAVAHGASPEDAWTSFLVNGAGGTLEAFPAGKWAGKLAGAFARADARSGGVVRRLLVDGLIEGGEEVLQEGTQQLLSNLVASELYDQDRKLLQDVLENAAAGGVSGMLLGVSIAAANRGEAEDEEAEQVEVAPQERPAAAPPAEPAAPAGAAPEAGPAPGLSEAAAAEAEEAPPPKEEPAKAATPAPGGVGDVGGLPPAAPPGMLRGSAGREGRLAVAERAARIPVRYAVVEEADLRPSHDPLRGFAKVEGSEPNERPYEDPQAGANLREGVERIAGAIDPDLILSDTPSPTDGPPVIRPGGQVLGGNARTMAMRLAYARGGDQAKRLRAAVLEAAERFGVPRADVEGLERPVLVRVVSDEDAGRPGDLSRLLNQSLTAARSFEADAASRGERVTQEAAAEVSKAVGEGTLAEALGGPSRQPIMAALVRAGAFSQADLTAMTDSSGGLTDAGKEAVRQALLASAVGDVRRLAEMTDQTERALIASLPAVMRLRAAWPEIDRTLRLALDAMTDARRTGLSIDEARRQATLEEQPWKADDRAAALARLLRGKMRSPKKVAAALTELAERIEDARRGQGDIFSGAPRTVEEAFEDVVTGAPVLARPERAATPAERDLGALTRAAATYRPREPRAPEAREFLVGTEPRPPEGVPPSWAGTEEQRAEVEAAIRRGEIPPSALTTLDDAAVVAARERALAAMRNPTSEDDSAERKRLRRELVDQLYTQPIVDLEEMRPGHGGSVPAGGVRQERRAWLVIGPPAAGKSTVAEWIAPREGARLLDNDMAKVLLPEYGGGLGASRVHEESSGMVHGDLLLRTTAAGDNFVMPMIGRTSRNVEALARELKEQGYDVHLVLWDLPPKVTAGRALERFRKTGRFVDPAYVLHDVGEKPRRTYDLLRGSPHLASWSSYSNDVARGEPPVLLEASERAPVLPAARVGGRRGGEGAGSVRAPDARAQAVPEALSRPDVLGHVPRAAGGAAHPVPGPASVPAGQQMAPGARVRETRAALESRLRASEARGRALAQGGGAQTEEDSAYAIVRDLSRTFGLGLPAIGRSRILRKKALGFYRPGLQDIRTRKAGAASTYAHELGHYLHEVMFPRATSAKGRRRSTTLSEADLPRAWRPELESLGRDLYGPVRPTGGYPVEGWAELVRLLVVNPDEARAKAPTTYAAVGMELAQKHPEVWLALQDARARFRNLSLLVRRNPVGQYVDHSGEARKKLDPTDAWDSFRATFFDRNQRARTFGEDLGLPDDPSQSPHVMALRMSGKHNADFRIAVEHGTFDPADPTRTKTGPSLEEVLRPVEKDMALWQDYMVARRALEKRGQGFETLPQDPDLPKHTDSRSLEEFIRRTEAANPHFGDYFRERGPTRTLPNGEVIGTEDPSTVAARFREFNRWLIEDYAVHYDLLTEKAAQLITDRNLEYVTFRTIEEPTTSGKAGAARGAQTGVRRFADQRGEKMVPPMEAFLRSMSGIMSHARLNEVKRAFVDRTLDGTTGAGRWLSPVDRPMEAQKIKGKDLSAEVQRQLGLVIRRDGKVELPPYLQDVDEDALAELVESIEAMHSATFWRPGNMAAPRGREIVTLHEGRPRYTEVKDERLLKVIDGLSTPATTATWVRWLGMPGRVLRAGATQKNPLFFVPNFWRDLMQALTLTDSELSNLPLQVSARLRGMRAAFMGGELERLFLASGADMASLFQEYVDPRTKQIDLRQVFERPRLAGLVKGTDGKRIALDMLKLGSIDRLNRAMELATRMGEFAVVLEQSLREGESMEVAMARAAQASADVTLDYQRGGTFSRDANQVVPFFNAAMLGTDKLARAIQAHPARAAARIAALLIAPSLASMLMSWDDEDYWSQPLRERDRKWFFRTGTDDQGRSTWVKVDKPYGLGIFSLAVERAVARSLGIDPRTGKAGGDPEAMRFRDTAVAILNELRPTLNIALLQPLAEVAANYSWYRDRPIVRRGDEDLPPRLQGSTYSSDVARVLGDLLDYPPAKIDHLISGVFGGLGRTVADAASVPLRRPDAAPLTARDSAIVRRFVAWAPQSAHEAFGRFYDDRQRLGEYAAELRTLEGEEKTRFMREHEAELVMGRLFDRAGRQLSKVFGEVRRNQSKPPTRDPDEFDAIQRGLYDEALRIVRAAYSSPGAIREAEERAEQELAAAGGR